MTGGPWHVCSFSVGIDELPKRKQKSMYEVAKVLAREGRFSAFEATSNDAIAHTMDRVVASKWFEFSDIGYPWTKVELTELGKSEMERRGKRRKKKR